MNEKPFEFHQLGDIAVFRFPDRPLFFASDLTASGHLLEALGQCGESEAVRAVVLLGSAWKAGSVEYDEFFQQLKAPRKELQLQRMLNRFNQLIQAVRGLAKPVVFADSGHIIAQMFNVGLSCDYRVVGADLIIEKSYLKHGLIPKGGGVLFLSQFLGRGKAMRVLLSEADLAAAEALELGLVDEVVPVTALESRALDAARRLAKLPATTVAGVKALMNLHPNDLCAHLERESREITRALRLSGFFLAD
jgi:enoyl-CoA hydratase/carnithine racemase